MAAGSTIEWTEATWNPVVGCSKVSAGCKHCYAERMACRLAAMADAAEAVGDSAGRKRYYRDVVNSRGRWNGRVVAVPPALNKPRRWRSPRMIFVNSMSDLFHDEVPLNWIQEVFSVMNECSRHTFQVLTKRPERAASVANRLEWSGNIWLGTSVENGLVADRIDALRAIPAKVRFLSLEPLLGPLAGLNLEGIHWVIAGGESGPGARAMDADWVRQIRDKCRASGVAFFFKQWGGVNKSRTGRTLDGRTWDEMPDSDPTLLGDQSHVRRRRVAG